jgi:hypothetical protein
MPDSVPWTIVEGLGGCWYRSTNGPPSCGTRGWGEVCMGLEFSEDVSLRVAGTGRKPADGPSDGS